MHWVDTEEKTDSFIWQEATVEIFLPTQSKVWFNHNMIGYYKM